MESARLNPQQREAVRHGDGPLLILAGAGTGKTRTLAHRIARLVRQGVPPEEILAVSFTNKAADELRERVQRLLGRGGSAPRVTTFHSFCSRVLRRDIGHLGYKRNFTIYDTADQLAVVRDAARDLRLAGRGDLDAKRLLYLISRAKNAGADPDPGDGSDPYALLAHAVYPRYAAALRAYNALDFDDLLLLALRLFEEHHPVLERWRESCRHVLVDEFQDTNAVQYRLVSLLARPRCNLTVVGDDDQSIYGWRGAEAGNIFRFADQWPEARVVTLEQNYRSTGRILSAANAVISRGRSRRPKRLWSDLGDGPPVTVMTCADGEDEAAAAAEWITARIVAGEARPGDCAILYRTNAQSRPFEDALRRARLRYVVVGGMRFYDRKEVRDLLSYLAAVHNPHDEISLLRVVNYPPRGIGTETIQRLQEESLRSSRPLREVMERSGEVPGVGERQAGAIASFLELLRRASGDFRPGRLTAAAGRLVAAAGLEGAVRSGVKDPDAGERKVENLREVVAALGAFEAANPGAGLGEYLAGVSLTGREEETGDFTDHSVTLLTVHAAKGLEYPHVFFAGLEEGLLPHRRSEADHGGLEEERRLVYVGMTRARRSLVLSHAAERLRREKPVPAVRSRFIDELLESDGRVSLVSRCRGAGESAEDDGGAAAAAFFRWTRERL